MKKLKEEEKENMQIINAYLQTATGINFIDRMEKFAVNQKISEVEVKEFLRSNYPGADKPKLLSKDDLNMLSLLLRYYCQEVKEYLRAYREVDATTIACPSRKPDLSFYDLQVSGFKASYEFVETA